MPTVLCGDGPPHATEITAGQMSQLLFRHFPVGMMPPDFGPVQPFPESAAASVSDYPIFCGPRTGCCTGVPVITAEMAAMHRPPAKVTDRRLVAA